MKPHRFSPGIVAMHGFILQTLQCLSMPGLPHDTVFKSWVTSLALQQPDILIKVYNTAIIELISCQQSFSPHHHGVVFSVVGCFVSY